MTLKVAHVVRQYLPSVGGMEEVVRNVAARQREVPGHEPRVITLDRLFRQRGGGGRLPASDEIEGVAVRRLPFWGSSRYPLCPGVLRALGDADIVHVHGVDFFHDFLAVTRPLHRRPLVLSTHGGFFHTRFARRLKTAWFHTVTRTTGRAYERVLAVSEGDGERFRGILPASRIEVIENGVDTQKQADGASQALQPRLIYFGRWSSNKGLPETLNLLRALRERDPAWRLVIAGRPYDHTAADLRRRAAEQGLAEGDALEIVASPSEEALRGYLGQASYFVGLSRYEGFGIAAIEAMSAGLTPVLSDIPSFRRLVERAGLGLLGDPALPDALAERLLEVHALGEAAYAERRRAAMAAAEGYAWPRIADQYLRIYERLGGEA
ncbi:glycosyltransferase [Halorhodospira neutriphila]